MRIQSETTKTILDTFMGMEKVTRKDIPIEDSNAVGVVLNRLTKDGVISRVERGIYSLACPRMEIADAMDAYFARLNPEPREPKKRGRPAKVKEPVEEVQETVEV